MSLERALKRIPSVALGAAIIAAGLAVTTSASASSHREAIATMNDPCIDNTDVYAWVEPGTHDKLYLISGYAGVIEPGQGNQQARLCDDVLYEFHIARGVADLKDKVTYQIQFSTTPPKQTTVDATLPGGGGGGTELLYQLGGSQQTYSVTKVENGVATVIGTGIKVAPANIGPRTDRLAYGLGTYAGWTDNASNNTGLYDDTFADSFITALGNGGSEGRAWAGTRDDPFYLDEKGIFDILNLNGSGVAKDVFAGFNLNVIALEVPTSAVTGTGAAPAHKGTPGDDTLIGVWASASRRKHRMLRNDGDDNYGPWVQVGREGLPLINAGMIGVQDQGKYLRTQPQNDVANFGAYFLNPVLVRDLDTLGAYAALGVPAATVTTLKSNRTDILKIINLDDIPSAGAHHVAIENGKTGDVLRVDLALDSGFPNGRPIPGGCGATVPCNKEGADVSDVLISVIGAGATSGLGDGVDYNDKNYKTTFPFAALPWQGLKQGHGGTTP
jgi:hypothetical protein